MKNFNGIQTKLKFIGETGCAFLCCLELANVESTRIIDCYDQLLAKHLIDEDCTINDWAGVMTYLTGDKYKAEKTKTKTSDDGFWVERWYNPRTGKNHFRLAEKDSLVNSVTVREGYIESYRHLWK